MAIDAGTSALKAVLFDARGRVLARAERRLHHRSPRPGWAEADPEDWWRALVRVVAELREKGHLLKHVAALGLTGQMHAAVLLDERAHPVRPAILWLDRRAESETDELQARLGLPPYQLNSTYTLPKLLWLKRHEPEALARTYTLLWPKDYLRHRLAPARVTDMTEAAGAGLLDWTRREWSRERLTLVGLSAHVLPKLRTPSDIVGPIRPDAARRLGLSSLVRIIVGAGDVIALLGAAPPQAGRLTCSLGSSAMLALPLAPGQTIVDPAHRLYIYPFLVRPLLNGVLSNGGAALMWISRTLFGQDTPLAVAVQAGLATLPGAESLLFLPFLAGERCPYWNDRLRGGFYGLTASHTRGHMVRAVMEGVAFSVRRLVEIAEELGATVREIALAGGGAAVDGWPQIFADVCQRPVLRFTTTDTVTRPLFAYCMTALDANVTFDAALTATFTNPPTYLEPRIHMAPIYDALYHRHRRMADFLNEMERGT